MRNEHTLNFDTWQTLGKASARLLSGLSKISEECFSPVYIRGVGEFGGVESAEVIRLTLEADLRLPLSSASAHDTLVRRFAPATTATVTDILSRRSLTQIDEPIVGGIPVDVVDHIGRPTSINIKPNDAMNRTRAATNPNPEISTRTESPRNHSLLRSGTGRDATSNDAGQWVISKELANQIYSYRFWVAGHGAIHRSEPTEKEQKQSDGQTGSGSTDDKRADEYAKYVDQRLRDFASFEKRASGRKD